MSVMTSSGGQEDLAGEPEPDPREVGVLRVNMGISQPQIQVALLLFDSLPSRLREAILNSLRSMLSTSLDTLPSSSGSDG